MSDENKSVLRAIYDDSRSIIKVGCAFITFLVLAILASIGYALESILKGIESLYEVTGPIFGSLFFGLSLLFLVFIVGLLIKNENLWLRALRYIFYLVLVLLIVVGMSLYKRSMDKPPLFLVAPYSFIGLLFVAFAGLSEFLRFLQNSYVPNKEFSENTLKSLVIRLEVFVNCFYCAAIVLCASIVLEKGTTIDTPAIWIVGAIVTAIWAFLSPLLIKGVFFRDTYLGKHIFYSFMIVIILSIISFFRGIYLLL